MQTLVIKKLGIERVNVPPELACCEICGEYHGMTTVRYLDGLPGRDRDDVVTLTCLCEGVMCQFCNKHPVHRPISNSYDPYTNTVHHWPAFTAMMKCDVCRRHDAPMEEHWA